ncbi:MAG: M67 family metallopeptidase [Myxococcota bacterium]
MISVRLHRVDQPGVELEAGSLRDALVAHAMRAWPAECVGALFGTTAPLSALELENAAPAPGREFELSAREYLRAEAEAERRGLPLLGFYHSHPGGAAEPSARDRALFGHFPVQVIIEVRGTPGPAMPGGR